MKFKEGEQVSHKSGGPRMTIVSSISKGSKYRCRWWDSSLRRFSVEIFRPIELAAVEIVKGKKGE